MIGSGSIVILHLVSPVEKLWGILLELTPAGVVFRGLQLSSFDDWLRQVASGETEDLIAPATMFVPLFRVERIFLDETVGSVESYRQRFESRAGKGVEEVLRKADDG